MFQPVGALGTLIKWIESKFKSVIMKFWSPEEKFPDNRMSNSGANTNFLTVSSAFGFIALNTLGLVLHKKAHDTILNDPASINCCLNRIIVHLSAMALPIVGCAVMPCVVFNGNVTLRRVVYYNFIEKSSCFQVIVFILRKLHLLTDDRVHPVNE